MGDIKLPVFTPLNRLVWPLSALDVGLITCEQEICQTIHFPLIEHRWEVSWQAGSTSGHLLASDWTS